MEKKPLGVCKMVSFFFSLFSPVFHRSKNEEMAEQGAEEVVESSKNELLSAIKSIPDEFSSDEFWSKLKSVAERKEELKSTTIKMAEQSRNAQEGGELCFLNSNPEDKQYKLYWFSPNLAYVQFSNLQLGSTNSSRLNQALDSLYK